MERVIKTTCFLADMADFPVFNQVYESYFVSSPARSCVAVKTLPKNVLCEIEAIAYKESVSYTHLDVYKGQIPIFLIP